MKRVISVAAWLILFFEVPLFAGKSAVRTFHGEVADSQCAMNVHSLTRSHTEMLKSKSMGGNATSCTLFCIRRMGGDFVVVSGDTVYYLDSQSALNFAGQRVRVNGILDPNSKTIHADTIELEK